MKNKNGINWEDYRKELYTDEEIEQQNAEAEFICMLAELRSSKKISQKQLEELSGIKQPMIARIENGDSIPRIDTLIRLLKPMGLTLKIVPIEENIKD